MKPRHIAMGIGVALAALLAIFGDNTPSTGIAEPVARVAVVPAKAGGQSPASSPSAPGMDSRLRGNDGVGRGSDGKGTNVAILRLIPRETLIGDGFNNGVADVFARQDWTPPPPPPPPEQAPPPPIAPPLPFTFIGKSLQDGRWEVYLSRGDRAYIARSKETIDGTYRVDAIAPPVLTLTYLPLNQVQQLNIGVFE